MDNNLIRTKTSKAMLINMPYSSIYCDYAFWYPKKLTYQIFEQTYLRFSEDFLFTLRKTNGKEIIDEIEINAETLKEIIKSESNKTIHTPKILLPTPVQIIDELKDED